MPCLTDANAEVVVLLLQPNQGCSRLESLYYISNIIPHIVGRLYELLLLFISYSPKHKKAYPIPLCSRIRVVDQEDPEERTIGKGMP